MAVKQSLRRFFDELDPTVFWIGFLVSVVAIGIFFMNPSESAAVMDSVNSFLWNEFMWVYVLAMFLMVAFSLWLLVGPWGKIKLGVPDEEPAFSNLEFFAMMFSAGIAAGIVFWGPAEALFHYDTVPPYVGAESQSTEAAVGALQYTLFHWGISYWVPYLVIGIPIAYFAYRHDAPMRISTVIAPFIGIDNLDGALAKTIDILAVFATIGGIATTLGFVGSQFLTGLEYDYGITFGDAGTILVISGLTIAFTVSVVLGVRKGIRMLSLFNLGLFGLLCLAVFALGPTNFIMNVGSQAIGGYISEFFQMSLYTNAGGGGEWVGDWTVFYWAWVFSWAAFGGLFVARISRGRTVRQVTATALLGATAATVPWFLTMGGTAIFFEQSGTAPMLTTVGEYGVEVSGFPLFEGLPFGAVLSAVFMLLVVTFFVTSADSSTLALGMLTTGGAERPSTINRVIWGALMGVLASLLIVGGGIDALRSAAIITGGPFAIVGVLAIIGMCLEFQQIRPLLQSDVDRSDSDTHHRSPESTSVQSTTVDDD